MSILLNRLTGSNFILNEFGIKVEFTLKWECIQMIIWLNGAFGAGKTHTAHELHRRIPDSLIYDPEQVGYFLNKNLPKELTNRDFQEHTIWRQFNYETLKYITSSVDRVIIVPMTVVNAQYFGEIIGKLKRDDVEVHQFVLWASEETLKGRLKSRFEHDNSWPMQQIERCMKGLSHEVFEEKIDTNNLSIEQVAELIATKVHIQLTEDQRSGFKKKWDRFLMRVRKV